MNDLLKIRDTTLLRMAIRSMQAASFRTKKEQKTANELIELLNAALSDRKLMTNEDAARFISLSTYFKGIF